MNPGEWREKALAARERERQMRISVAHDKITEAMNEGLCSCPTGLFSYKEEVFEVARDLAERGFDVRVFHDGWTGGINFYWKAATDIVGVLQLEKSVELKEMEDFTVEFVTAHKDWQDPIELIPTHKPSCEPVE